MDGQLTIYTLKASSGVLATQNGMTGIAKAWVNYNGVAQTIRASYNVSSVTYNATGDYTVNFTTALPNANYAIATSNEANGGLSVANPTNTSAPTTASLNILAYRCNGTVENSSRVSVTIFSS